MSRLRARCPDCRTLTAVAMGGGYECHACGGEFAAGLVRVPRAWGQGGDPMEEAAYLPLPYPEAGVVQEEALRAQNLAVAAALPEYPLVLGGCCCAHVGAVEGLAARHPALAVVWLDAHGDLNTPETSPSGNEWGMPLRMLLDARTIEPGRTVLLGARNLDPPEEEYLRETGIRTSDDSLADALADADAVYVAFDGDVLDPREELVPFMPEPGGMTLEGAERTLARVAATAPVAGLGFTGLAPVEKNVEVLSRLARAAGL